MRGNVHRRNPEWRVGQTVGLPSYYACSQQGVRDQHRRHSMLRSLPQTVCFVLGFATIGGIVATAMISHQSSATAQDPSTTAPLRHVVLFKFKADATKEQIQEIITGFEGLPKKIDGITAFEYGTDVSPEGLADGFTH